MNLPQRAERTQAFGQPPSTVGAAPKREPFAVDLRALTRRVPAAQPVEQKPKDAAQREPDVAFGLLEQAASALPALMDRTVELEAELEGLKTKARADLVAAQSAGREWQTIATSMAAQIETLKGDLTAMQQRVEATEADAASVKALVEKSNHRVAEAECLSTLFHDRVVSALGVGTAAHGVLETLKARAPIVKAD